MPYDQYSSNAYTGNVEDVLNRISSNSNSTKSETVLWPTKFDAFTNKENTALAGFSVTEAHSLSDLVGTKLYLDHRPAVDSSGQFLDILTNKGVIATGSTDLFQKSITFSTAPTEEPFFITYTAQADKVEDSHINALQNAVMAIQNSLGLKTPTSGVGTGIVSLNLFTQDDVGTAAELTALQNIVPGIRLGRHLQEDFYIMSTNDADVPAQNITIYVGNTGTVSRDELVIDVDSLTVQATNTSGANSTPSGNFLYSTNTGDHVWFSGQTEFASRVTVGKPHGNIPSYDATVAGGDQEFYDNAALAVHGGIFFGNGLTGNGSVTLTTTTGEAVEVQGTFNATSLSVDGSATFDGPTELNDDVNVKFPGSFRTNSDIALNDKPGGSPAKIDGLDPSYAKASIGMKPVVDAVVVDGVRHVKSEQHENHYAQNAKHHPQMGTTMYPLVGGWTFTGKVQFEKASTGQHDNVFLLSTAMPAIGFNWPNGSNNVNIGGGSNPYGSYCTGFFNPGDMFIEFDLPAGNANNFSYPIYYHDPEPLDGGVLTGVNVYVAADNEAFEDNTALAGVGFRIYQPGNVPLDHLRADGDSSFNSASAPVVQVGNQNTSDYPTKKIKLVTDKAWDGGSAVDCTDPLYKELQPGSTASVNLSDALTKSIDGHSPSVSSPQTGVAYVYAASRASQSTDETAIQLRATPTPFGIASQQVWKGGFDIKPGKSCPVGEVWASTTNGTDWSLVDIASYRPDGFYDSGWVPMVEYRSALSTLTSIPNNLGRCLPVLGSTDSTEYKAGEQDHNFFVEHNLGPLRSLTEVTYTVWCARFKTLGYQDQHLTHLGGKAIYKQTAAGDMNLWSPPYHPYEVGHDFYPTDSKDGDGQTREMNQFVQIRGIDSRFARFACENAALENYSYIRIFVHRIR